MRNQFGHISKKAARSPYKSQSAGEGEVEHTPVIRKSIGRPLNPGLLNVLCRGLLSLPQVQFQPRKSPGIIYLTGDERPAQSPNIEDITFPNEANNKELILAVTGINRRRQKGGSEHWRVIVTVQDVPSAVGRGHSVVDNERTAARQAVGMPQNRVRQLLPEFNVLLGHLIGNPVQADPQLAGMERSSDLTHLAFQPPCEFDITRAIDGK